MRKKNIDISTEEKKNEVFDLFNGFNSKSEAYKYFGLSDNSLNSRYLTEISEQIGFDLNLYKERRKKPIKYCQECGKEITSRDGKLFCSSSCAAKYNNKHRDKSVYEKLAEKLRKKDKADKPKKEKQVKEPKPKVIKHHKSYHRTRIYINKCEYCGLEFETKNKNARFCSNKCIANASHVEAYNKYINNQDDYCRPNYVPKPFKEFFLEEQNNQCAICGCLPEHNGKKLVFVLDHIDGDASNNHRDNLRLVCPNCDSQLDTFKSKNKNSTRRNYFREKILQQLYSN